MSSLPTPSEAAFCHSRAVRELICAEIAAAGGWISFARYMELALYAPGMGYYSSGTAKLGGAGDFVTAPEISPLFGRAVAAQAAQVLELMGDGGRDMLEFGAGTGKLALDLLLELEKLDSLPERYFILEVSADLQQRQRQRLERFAPHLSAMVIWREHLPATFNGLILANEVLDAMPVHLVAWRETGLFERGVTWSGDDLRWLERPLAEGGPNGNLLEVARELSPQPEAGSGIREGTSGYISEISLATRGFVGSLANTLQQGAIVLIDYGFGRSEYYHSQRNRGTLMCHYRHYAHDDPFYLPGLQDITSHVDFTAVAEIGIDAGLELLGYTTQANFLINCGITNLLAQTSAENAKEYLPLANQLQKLVSPAEMGELFKVIALAKNIRQPLIGFTRGDKSRIL